MSMPHSEVKECENHQSWRDLIIGGAVMYAIIATGGKQYKVSEGDVIKVEKLDAEVGAKVTFDNVLLVGSRHKFPVHFQKFDKGIYIHVFCRASIKTLL